MKQKLLEPPLAAGLAPLHFPFQGLIGFQEDM